MSITLLDPPTSAEIGVVTKSTAYRAQFAVEADASGGALLISGPGFSPTTALKALMGSGSNAVPFHATALLSLFNTPTTGTAQSAAAIMEDVQVTSRTIATSDTPSSAVPPCGYALLGDVAGNLFPVLYIVAPATSAGGVWSIIIELRQSSIG